MFREVYRFDVLKKLKEGHKVYAVINKDGYVEIEEAAELSVQEWADHNGGEDMFFLEVIDE